MRVYLNGIGLIAPGLEGIDASMPVLCGELGWANNELPKIPVDMLPANERRRTTRLIRHALLVAKMALDDSGSVAADLASVFASSDGDTDIVNSICEALCNDDIFVSPTHFHNSVHNAVAGYWAIATKSHAPSTSVSSADGSFASGLLESMVQVHMLQADVLFVAFDHPPPPPLDKKRDIKLPFALALLLSKTRGDSSSPCISVDPKNYLYEQAAESRCQNKSLRDLQYANPAARALPLLECIYRKNRADLVLPYEMECHLMVTIEP